jgi:ribosomal protein S18 acetylase RimI-like enzyme
MLFMVEVVRLEKIGENTVAEINALLAQLAPHYELVTPAALEKMIVHPDIELWTALDEGKIVGITTLIIMNKLSGISSQIEHVVVDGKYRGQGLGEALMKKLIERAGIRHAKTVMLTSRPVRVAANKLYQKLGFERKETNVYRLNL